jgi:hypothetical protein
MTSERDRRLADILQSGPQSVSVDQASDDPTVHSDLCEIRRREGRLDEAIAHGRHALRLGQDNADAWYNLGIAFADRLELDRAEACQRRAIALAPEAAGPHFELAEVLLATGRFDEGWGEYEWRYGLPGAEPPLPPAVVTGPNGGIRPQWDGRPLAPGRLLLVADQGFGDVIQFCRYLPLVARRAPEAMMACSREIAPILKQLRPYLGDIHLTWDTIPDFDAWAPLSGLPHRLGGDPAAIPAANPYLRADQALVERWRRRLDELVSPGYRRIGLAWAGRPAHGNDANRSMRLSQLAPLTDLDGVALVSLQKGPAQAEIGGYLGRAPLINLGGEIMDFADTLAILQSLERLVSVDTSVAHLAGASAVPVSVLLPFAPDWRWMLDRKDSPWYPTMVIHRQAAPRQWDSVIKAAATLIGSAARTSGPMD